MGKKRARNNINIIKAAARAIAAVGRIKESEPKFFKEILPEAETDDPTYAFKQHVFEVVKNAFGLAYSEDEQVKINVDNIFPLLKALGLNPQTESVVDLVREACMESYGDIDPADFEKVVLSLTKRIDDDLWVKRLEEKEELFRKAEEKKATLEVERLRREEEIKKIGFEQEDDDTDEWAEYDKKKKEIEDAKTKELQADELYDNIKMAFRFIDSDDDGVISTKDLYTLMMGLGEMLTDDELFGMVNLVDLDCDGKVTFEDFKTFMVPKSGEEDIPETQVAADDTAVDKSVTENDENGNTDSPSEVTTEVVDKTPEPTQPIPTNKVEEVEEITDEEKERRNRRKKSMLWGYMNTATKVAVVVEKLKETTIEENISETETPVTNTNDTMSDQQAKEDDTPLKDELLEVNGQLDAIREEDEHSNYELTQGITTDGNTEVKTTASLNDNKRKLFSRQCSATSLKTRPNSVITGTESTGDSGIDTLDTMCGSEIREQPDVFDISDEENETENRTVSPRSSTTRRNSSKSPLDYYSVDEDDDEDMIDAHHVYESLSRVSSPGSHENVGELPESLSMDNKENNYAEERTRNFVNAHMYIEIPSDITDDVVQDAKLTEERLTRAITLQKAILRRSSTEPLLTVFSSRSEKLQTAKPSVNGLTCSHIDIDLTCESTPPKADIKSFRQYSARIRSAQNNRREWGTTNSGPQTMAIIDVGETLRPNESRRSNFPARPLTRPRSPNFKRAFASAENINFKPAEQLEIKGITREKSKKPARARSAVLFRRPSSPSLPVSSRQRPQTATIPYAGSRRIETDRPFTKIEKKEKYSVVVSQPFTNSDDLYPNKSILTTYHHGFKSIWPIGRKINLLQSKQPFSAFEMNSYSRSIERRQFPFRPDRFANINTCFHGQNKGLELKGNHKELIQLKLNTDMTKPTVKSASTLVTQGFRPRPVR